MERSDEARREDALYDTIGSLERQNKRLDERIQELEKKIIDIATYANGLENAQNLIEKRFKDFEAEMQNIANQLMDLYTECVDSAEPKVYGTILGLHERLEKFLKG